MKKILKRIKYYFSDPPSPAHDVRPYLRMPVPLAMLEGAANDMERLFYGHVGRQSFKWHHYLEVYDRHLNRFRNTPVKIIEIGVQTGGSLQIWRKYFGRDAIIFGIDIDKECARFDNGDAKVRIGSQNDPIFLRNVISEMGGVDIVIDDGSHVAEHQKTSFETLFPLLSNCGVYICEDLQTSYWKVYHNGGYKRTGTFIEVAKQLIDDMHAWYHDRPSVVTPNAEAKIFGISFYDGIAVIEKREKERGYFSGMPPLER